MRYEQISDLAQWEPHSVMVHVGQDQTALVRLYHLSTIPNEWFSIGDALRRAHSMVRLQPDYRDVVIYLEDGASWEEEHGELVAA
ncbi:hypothetical protein JZX87_09985 [Agrobacterium sp. Ap1]|uniref:hypothetical protein n=1 Tax=Agrobacterium sp. Ap1 TaxID=2815337 RepID=UPI001A8CD5C4|nr:hypothetical protein [Agrobacterium sp. Ap1]MBO0141491.1 hypothetical protein [Agrobacterium sp. Ap1]